MRLARSRSKKRRPCASLRAASEAVLTDSKQRASCAAVKESSRVPVSTSSHVETASTELQRVPVTDPLFKSGKSTWH